MGNGRLPGRSPLRAFKSRNLKGDTIAMNVSLRERLAADGIVVNDRHARHFFE